MNARLPLLCLLLVSPGLWAAPETVAQVLQRLDTHGFISPPAAVARLQAAGDAGDPNAPLDQRRRYYTALMTLSLPDWNTGLLNQSLDMLEQMATRERCEPCRIDWLIGKAHAEIIALELEPARAHLKQADLLIGADDLRTQLLLALARIDLERAQGINNVAFAQALKAEALAERLGQTATHIDLAITLTVLYGDLGYFDRADASAKQAIAQAQVIGYTAAVVRGYLNLAYTLSLRGRHDEELELLKQALQTAQGVQGLGYLELYIHANLSGSYFEQGKFALSLQHAKQSAALARFHHNLYAEAGALANIGFTTAKMGDFDAGMVALKQSLQMAHDSGRVQLEVMIGTEMVNLLQTEGHYRQALELQLSLDEPKARFTRQKRDNAVLQAQAKFDDERRNREIERLSTEAKLKDAEAAAHNWQLRLWITLAGATLLATFAIVMRLLRAWRANRKLTEDVSSLTEQSTVDSLTGAFNRRHFASLIERGADDPEQRVGLVMLDIDHFKRINDNYGHDAGDIVLREVALRLQALGREGDSVVRWGGEEFVLVLPNVLPDSLPAMAERLLDAIASQPIRIGSRRIHTSVSAGCVVHPLAAGSSWEQALKLADLAMYRAKHNGRNRATCVTTVGGLSPDATTDEDLAAAIRSGAVRISEVHGPQKPDAAAGNPASPAPRISSVP